MDAPKRNYNSKVLLGNWYNENRKEEDKLAMYLKKKERKQILTIGVWKLFENFLKHIPLSLPTKGLAYGSTIQLLAPDVVAAPSYASEKPRNGLVLAATIYSSDLESTQSLVEDLLVVGSPLRKPCARNAFIIESEEDKQEGDEFCYGDTFSLRLADKTPTPLYVDLPVPTLCSPVGKCGFPVPSLKVFKGLDSRFKVLHLRKDLRFFTDGTPCAPFERVIINHAPSNIPLCCENEYWTMSLFSYECEISSHTKPAKQNQYDISNMWMFTVGSGLI